MACEEGPALQGRNINCKVFVEQYLAPAGAHFGWILVIVSVIIVHLTQFPFL